MTSIIDQLRLTDAQTAAATTTDTAMVVTAGAGSGKTRTLAARFVGLLDAGYPLRSLVAVTFTDKAAREMRSRIRRLVAGWLDGCGPAELPRWQSILAELDAARIGTIHSLCAAVLRAHPAEVGIDPTFAVLEENTAAVLRARALESAMAWAANDAWASALFGLLTEFRLQEALRALLDRRLEAQAAFGALGEDPLAIWDVVVKDWLDSALSTLAWRGPLAALAGLQARRGVEYNEDDRLEQARRAVLGTWDRVQVAWQSGQWDVCLEELGALRGAIVTGGAKAYWDPDALSTARQAMADLRGYFDRCLAPLADRKKPLRWALDRQAAGLLPLLRMAFERALAEYTRAKNERNALDFDDLEALAASLLDRDAAVRARWQAQIQAVLVDEFQDTNARQRQIIYALSGFTAPRNRPADLRSTEKDRALFIVGDAKQSIYRFRGADVAVFREVEADIVAAGGRPIDLDLTFRAHEPLVTALNALLAPILGQEDDAAKPYQVRFAPLRAHRRLPRSGLGEPYVEFHLGLGENAEEGRRAAAGALARRLHEMHAEEQVAWSDVALLFRASTGFPPYEDALEQAGIPFVTVAGRGFYERPEVRDLLNALAALADPSDDLSLAGLLRSPAIGLTDAALYRLRLGRDGQRRGLWAALAEVPAAEVPAAEMPAAEAPTGLGAADAAAEAGRAALAWNLVRDLSDLAGRAPVGQLLKQLLDATGYRAALALAGGERLLRNVDKLLDDAYRSGLVSVNEFLEYVQTLRDVGARESEAATEAQGAVQLMTVHKAKGLEFPIVVVADAGRSDRFAAPPVVIEADWGVLLDVRDGDARPVVQQLAAMRQADMEMAESRRLLYVAATRAQERLIVSGHARLSTAKGDPGRLRLAGWLAWLGEGIGLDAVRLDALPAASQSLDLAWEGGSLACVCHPPASWPAPAAPEPARPQPVLPEELDLLPGLGATPGSEAADTKALSTTVRDRESDPPPRVWRIVPRVQHPAGPAWVVGTLVHATLRRWRFPAQPDFEVFLYPHALDAGLTDQTEILNAMSTARRLLERFAAHPLWAEMDAAERHHELPYVLGQERGIIDLLYRAAGRWTVAEFKTDRLPDLASVEVKILQEEYRSQVGRYVRAVEHLLGTCPRALLIFLNAAGGIQIVEL